ncbi:hypothetical protein [Lysinibacillus sp. LZ02]|uniref:hypothetical protein n=1 Tax=Lysinibacillus sp. LZ02 TaxID=3420668 RepID=UPI003D35F0BD
MIRETLTKVYRGSTYLTIPCSIRTSTSILSYQQPILHKNVLAQIIQQSIQDINKEGTVMDMVPVILCSKSFLIDGLDAQGCYVYDFVQHQMIYGALHMEFECENPYAVVLGYIANGRQPKFDQQFIRFGSLLEEIQIEEIHKELTMQLYDEPQQVYLTHLISRTITCRF